MRKNGGSGMVRNRVKEFRRAAGLTLAELAERSGVPVSTIKEWMKS